MYKSKQYDTFNTIFKNIDGITTAITFSVVGYDVSKIDNIYTTIDNMINTMTARGDFVYESETDYIRMIIDEAWKKHIHLEYDYPTFGTFQLN